MQNISNKLVNALIIWHLVLSAFGGLLIFTPEEQMKVSATTWTVDDDGPADFSSIQSAINAANPGDTIFVYSGTYYENVLIGKTLTLIGESNEMTVIDGTATGDVVRITANWVNISGFTMKNSSPDWDAGIELSSASNCKISYCNVLNNYHSYGIALWTGSNSNMILNNFISDNYHGVLLGSSSGNTIMNNTIWNNENYGIWVRSSSNSNTIEYNSISYNSHGIRVIESSSNNEVHYNNICDNINYGVSVDDSASQVNATNNWWGDLTGPYHSSANPSGLGDEVTDYVVFNPWLDSPMIFNHAPEITTSDVSTATEDLLYYVDYNGTDIDGHELTWFLTTNSTWLTITEGEGILSGTPTNDDVGSYWVNVSCFDDHGGYDWSNFTLTVINTNDPPTFTSSPITIATEDELYTYDANATDIDPTADVLTYSLTTSPAGMTIDSATGEIYWTPTNDQVGENDVTIQVDDGNEGTDIQSFTITVIGINDPPTIVAPSEVTVYEDIPKWVNITIDDVDNDPSDLEVNTTSPRVEYVESNSTLKLLYPEDSDSETVTVNVSDGLAITSTDIQVTFISVNDPPEIECVDSVTVYEDIPKWVKVTLSDSDNEITDLEVTTDSDYITWEPENSTLKLLYPNGASSETVRITVSDGQDASYHDIDVTYKAVNDPPIIECQDAVTVIEDIPLWVNITIDDVDNELSELLVTTSTSYVEYIESNSTLRFLYPNNASSEIVRVTVSDGIDTDYKDINVTFIPVNDAPIIDCETEITVTEGKPKWVDVHLEDIDSNLSALNVTTNSSYVKFIKDNSTLRFLYPIGTPSEIVRVTVSDEIDESYIDISVTVIPTTVADTDGDGYPDDIDAFPEDPDEWLDTDNDGFGNNADIDDDGDGYTDEIEQVAGTDPLDSNSHPVEPPDTDGDGIPDPDDPDDDNDELLDTEESERGTDSLNPDTDGDGYNDKEDAYPLDDTRWKREVQPSKGQEFNWLLIIVLINVIIAVVVIVVIIFIWRKKKEKDEREAREKALKEEQEKRERLAIQKWFESVSKPRGEPLEVPEAPAPKKPEHEKIFEGLRELPKEPTEIETIVKCYKCKRVIDVPPSIIRPVKLKCPSCGTESVLE